MRRGRRQTAALAAAASLLATLAAGCGGSGPPPPWRPGHPDPASLSLLGASQAGGCASSAPHPDQAPSAIRFQGTEYVQRSRLPAQAQPAGAVEIDHTGDWAFWEDANGDLTMTAPQADYLYVAGGC